MNRRGFTLIELSIVIVVVGFVVSGIVGGLTLVHQAELRQVIRSFHTHIAAIATFRLEYQSLPGDLRNAHNYWGDACDVVALDCNGNGDGYITYGESGSKNEALRVWQHMYLAGIYSNAFTGELDVSVGGYGMRPRVNAPAGVFNDSVFALWQNNQLRFANVRLSGGSVGEPNDSALSPGDAYNLDSKMDDGLARSGIVYASHGDDATTGCYSGMQYARSNAGLQCRIEHYMFYRN